MLDTGFRFKPPHYCSICENPILFGEEYIKREPGVEAHYDCFRNKRELTDWFGATVLIMGESDEKYY